MLKPRLLLIADVRGWIFERHCLTLQRLLSDEFDISITYQNEPFREQDFDLVYPLEWYMADDFEIGSPEKYVTGIRSHLVWPELEFGKFVRRLNTNFNRVHVVSRRLFEIFGGFVDRLHYVTHGVDTLHFSPSTPAGKREGNLRIGWAGNRGSRGNKGYDDIIAPLGEIDGVELTVCGYSDRKLDIDEMRSFYDQLDVYVCASTNFEGNNNSLMEAAAMARAIVTTDNGTVPEYLIDGVSAFVLDREADQFARAIRLLRDNRGTICEMGTRAQRTVRAHWDWRTRVQEYRSFFWEALAFRGATLQ